MATVYPTSPEFLMALNASSRRWAARVEVLDGEQQLAEFTTVEDGRVRFDDVAVRRDLDVKVVDPTGALTPNSARDLLAPTNSTEIRVWRGLHVPTGISPALAPARVEWVPLGVFRVTQAAVEGDNGATVITLHGRDRVDAVRKRRFTAPWRVARGTPTHEAIAAIITSRLDVPVRITATEHTTPEVVYDELSDPWDAVRDLADADSLAAYFDPLGAAVIAPRQPSPTGMTYGTGGLLLKGRREMTDDDTYSGVIVTGEHPDHEGVRAVVWDTDPRSPTYHLGPFGQRPYGFSSPLLTSNAQALAAGQTLLPQVTQMLQTGTLDTIGHPGHDVDDVIEVADEDSRTLGSYSVRGGTVPLRPRGGPIQLKIQEVSRA